MTNSWEWYWRFHLGLPPRPEDRETLRRIAPELFDRVHRRISKIDEYPQQRVWRSDFFRQEVQNWLAQDDSKPLTAVPQGSCPQLECPLRLGGSPGQILGGQHVVQDGSLVLELMTVAGGWKSKKNTFLDMARKVHGGKGPIKDLLITDPFLYQDKSEEETPGGINNFLSYLDSLEVLRPEVTIHQPPYAKGKKAVSGPVWRKTVTEHGRRQGYQVKFTFFRTVSETRFHDRFYVARHADGSMSGLFGPSMNGLDDKSFVLVGELEEATMKRLCAHLDGWQ